jgi:hypothetical protein
LFPATTENANLVHDEIFEREKNSERPDQIPAPLLPPDIVVNPEIDPLGE